MSAVGTVTPSVDLRSHWTGVRDQGARGSCLACACTDAHTHAHGLQHPLSVDALYYHGVQRMPGKDPNGGLTFAAARGALADEGQCREVEWPYPSLHPKAWAPPASISERWFGALEVEDQGSAGIVEMVKAQVPVVLGLTILEGFRDVDAPDYLVQDTGAALGGHAVLAVGLGVSASGSQLVLVRNSWGFQWGCGGCAWVDTGYIDAHLVGYAGVGVLKHENG